MIFLGLPSSGWGQSLTCGPAEAGTVQIDGLLDDWKGVPMVEVGGDPGVSLGCNTEGKTLLFVVHVNDARFVRTAKNGAGEDHFELAVGGKTLVVFPGDANKIKERVSLGKGAGASKGLKVSSSLQRGGWAVELAVPLAALGVRGLSAALPYKLTVYDCDSAASLKTEQRAVLEGELQFEDAAAAVKAFLDDRGLKPSDVWFDKPLRIGGKTEARLVLAGRYIAVIHDGYSYREAPVQHRREVKEVNLLDLAGDGRQALVLRYVEEGQGGAKRELLAIYRFGAEVQRLFVAEVARSVDKSLLQSKVTWQKRGKATDLVIEAGVAQGFGAENFRDWGGEEIVGLALPWGPPEDKKQRYQFTGNEYRRAP